MQILLKIINLKGLGRVKARTLVANNINSFEILKNTPPETLINLNGFGPKLVQSLYEQMGQEIILDGTIYQKANNYNIKTRKLRTNKKTSSLIDFVKE